MTSLDNALALAARGFRVVWVHCPVGDGCSCGRADCRSRGKHPILARWQDAATLDAEALEAQFAVLGVAAPNVGIQLGPQPDGRYLVAIDDDDPIRFADLQTELGQLPGTLTIGSARGGKALYHVPPHVDVSRLRNVTGLLGKPGVDVKAENGQVVAPPSQHPSGIAYHWRTEAPSAELPMRWVEAIQRPVYLPPVAPVHVSNDSANRVERARAYIGKMPPSLQGSNGSSAIFAVARKLAQDFGLSESDGWALLAEWNQANAKPPWSDRDLRHKFADACKARVCNPVTDRPRASSAAPPRQHGVRRSDVALQAREEEDEPSHDYDTDPEAREDCSEDRFDDSDAGRVTGSATELRNAERLREFHGEELRHVGGWSKWLAWDGARWVLDDSGGALRCATDTHRRILAEATDALAESERAFAADPENEELRAAHGQAKGLYAWAMSSQSSRRLEATLAIARSFKRLACRHEALDADPWTLTVVNGTLDLQTGQLRPHRREDLCTKLAPVAFDPGATCPTWEAFLARAMGGDGQLVGYLRRLVGYALTGIIGEHVLAFSFGTGANGKSVFHGVIHRMLGDYACQAPRDILFASKGERHPTGLTTLHGARFVTCAEIGEGQAFDEALVKDLTGGDSIRARRMREDHWEFVPSHKLFISGNYKPIVRGDDEGIWRRIRLIPWNVTIPAEERDKDLPAKLDAELPGILAWGVRGCLEWQRDGLGDPPAVVSATAQYRTESDHLGEFFASAVTFERTATMPRADLRKRYESWCEEAGYLPVGARKLAERLQRDGVTKTGVRTADGPRDGWKGIRFATAADLATRTWVAQPSVVGCRVTTAIISPTRARTHTGDVNAETAATSHDLTTTYLDPTPTFSDYLAGEGIS